MTEKSTTRPHRNFYGRIKGKGLHDSHKRYLAEDLGNLAPKGVSWEENPERKPLDLTALFGNRPVWLEIGFGAGEHMIHQAINNPDVGIIGCEPYINGVATLLGKIRKAGASNLAVHPGDARDMMDGRAARGLYRQGVFALSRSMAQKTPSPAPVCHTGAFATAGPLPETRRDFAGGHRYSRLRAPNP